MAYLGNSPVLSQQEYRNIDNISGSFNGSTTSFALLVNGVAPVPAPQSSNQCLISVNGVVQKPDDTGATGFRISGGNIIFSSAPTGGQSFFGVILAGADYIYAGENFPDGTVSAPSITFAQDLDTGFFRSGAGEIKYTANGTAVVTLSSNNLTAPSFIPTSSSAPTNGVYLPAANSVGISTNSTERLRITSAGLVGIGTSSPAELVHLLSGSGSDCFLRLNSTSSANNSGIRWQSGGVARGIIASDGAFGGSTADFGILAEAGLSFYTNGTTTKRMVLDTSGRVGIGNTAPNEMLTIGTSSAGGNIRLNSSSYGNNGLLNFIGTDGNLKLQISTGASQGTLYTPASTNLAFEVGNSERARIDSSGRLLVGTSSTSAQTRALFQGNSAGTSTAEVFLAADTNAPGGGLGNIYFSDNSHSKAAIIAAVRDGGTWTSGSSQPTSLQFYTTVNGASSPTERLRIANNGQLSAVVPGNSTLYPGFLARAWINFDGTSASIGAGRASGNVSSVTDNGTGDYTINFSTAMPDTNYCVVTGMSGNAASSNGNEFYVSTQVSGPSYNSGYTTTSSIRMLCMDGSGTNRDAASLNLAVFR